VTSARAGVARPARRKVPWQWLVTCAGILAGVAVVTTGSWSALLDGYLNSPDGYMRLVRVERLLGDPSSWYDPVIARSNVPVGEHLHWTRPLDFGLALLAAVLRPVLGDAAVLASGLVLPPLILVATCAAAAWMVRPLLDDLHPAMAALFVFGQPLVVSYGLPGRADHHLLILLFSTLAFGATVRLVDTNGIGRAAAVGGLATGLGIWVSVEALLAYGVVTIALGVLWLLHGPDPWARRNRACHLWTLATLAVALALERPIGDWLATDLDRISAIHLALAAGIALFWTVAERLRELRRAARAALAAGAAAVLVAGLTAIEPNFLQGPFGNVDPRLAEAWLSQVQELEPLPLTPGRAIAYLGAPVAAMALLPVLIGAGSPARRGLAVLGLALVVPTLLGIAQLRWFVYSQLIGSALLAVAVSLARSRLPDRFRYTVLKALLVPAAAAGWLVVGTIIGAPSASPRPGTAPACAEADVIESLRSAAFRHRRTIAAHVDLGPAILFLTPHAVVAAPYHGSGTLAVYDALNATDTARARRLLDAREVDLVIVCPGLDESLFLQEVQGRRTLYGQLRAGHPPSWLRPLDGVQGSKATLYGVVRADPDPDRAPRTTP
jgi:asparagine N-glycosylation enzyme membrane subunit Stt3